MICTYVPAHICIVYFASYISTYVKVCNLHVHDCKCHQFPHKVCQEQIDFNYVWFRVPHGVDFRKCKGWHTSLVAFFTPVGACGSFFCGYLYSSIFILRSMSRFNSVVESLVNIVSTYWIGRNGSYAVLMVPDQSWASNQIRKVVGCAGAGNAGNVFLATDFKGNRELAIPACITTRAWCTCRDACRDRQPAGVGTTFPDIPGACTIHNFTYLIRGPCSTSFVQSWWQLYKALGI